jgi:hypothetical protein
VQVLHLVKAQCSGSPFVTKVKLVERTFDGDASVRFEMYDAAPTAPPATLPYLVKSTDSKVVTDENEAICFLAESGAPKILTGEGIKNDAVADVLSTAPAVGKAVKLAVKSKTEAVC